jgi:D-alanyl-lipoteichoic acid acyltransferase DltB (MBOAT superfamily)
MAIGLGLIFNIKLPQNFDSPYKSASIIEFWRRWHMTLSRFLREYLYFPLGGNRKGSYRQYANLMITMTLGGLWHGASWNFVIWGFLHGLALAGNHVWRLFGFRMHWLLGRIITFLFLVFTWVIFRAEDLHQALVMVKGMLNIHNIGIHVSYITPNLPAGRHEIIVLFAIYIFVSLSKNSSQLKQQLTPNWKWALAVSFCLIIGVYGLNRVSQFLYFQF